jgi:ribosomal protein L40E
VPDDERRCPSCGALVAPDATWCGQCFTSLREPPGHPDPGPTAVATPSATGGTASASAQTATASDAGTAPYWPCPVCEGRNPIEADVCATCGTPFAAVMRTDEARPNVEPRDAVLWSLVLPGLGHRLVGRGLDGFARAVLFVMSVGMAVLLFVSNGSALTSALTLLFIATAIAVYAVSAIEAARLAQGGELMIGSRVLLWILVGMTFVSVGALALAVTNATPG